MDEPSNARPRLDRRAFLRLSAVAGATTLLAACAPSTPPAPTAAPAKPAESKPAAASTTAPAAPPTTAPAAAAPAKAGPKRELVLGAFGDPGNLNPILRSDIPGGVIQHNIVEPLVRPNYETREIEPLVAESWKMVDPLNWQIKLREGVTWHKGYGEVTAEDLAYTWMHVVENKTFQFAAALFPVESVNASSKYVADVKLKQPFGAFPGVTMGYGGLLVSKKAHEEMGNEKYARNTIGNGPYTLESWTSNAEVVLKKNPEYWQKDVPVLDQLIFRIIPDQKVRLQALQKGEVDFMTHPDVKDALQVRNDPNLLYTSTAGWNWDYQEFTFPPIQVPDFPNQNKLVRQAISYAIDREAIVKEIYSGEATPTDNSIPAGFLGHRAPLLRYPKNADLNKARELMAQAGVRGYEVDVITSDKDWLRRELELVAAMVSQIGITYKIKGLDMGSYNNVWLTQKKYDQLLEDITIVSPDPDSCVWWFYHSKGSVTAGYNVPEMDQMLDQARAESEPNKRETIYHQVVDRALEDLPLIFHVNVNYVRMHKKGLAGYEPSPQEYIELFKNARWES
jgi:peptide/nickel transport system substrate-binding protein